MDPDAAMREIRRLVATIVNGGEYTEVEAERLAELVDGLDEWLSKGGFLPGVWAEGRI